MALPGNGTVLAVSKEREALYERAARAIIKLVERDLKPRDIATLEAFDNALALDVAMGGSTNTILHTLAIAREAGIPYDIKRIDDISRRVPACAKFRRPRTTTCRTCTAPAASTPSWANSSAWAR